MSTRGSTVAFFFEDVLLLMNDFITTEIIKISKKIENVLPFSLSLCRYQVVSFYNIKMYLVTLTYKPAIITLLHHLYNVSFSELQLVSVLWFVVVNRFVSKTEDATNHNYIAVLWKNSVITHTVYALHETYGWRCTAAVLGLFGAGECGKELTCGLD